MVSQPPPVTCPSVAPAPATVAIEPAALHDLRWELQVGNASPLEPPTELHQFSVGRWECALGKLQVDDAREPNQLILARARKVVCTHASGATVQTTLACELVTPLGVQATAPVSGRSLVLELDTAPKLALRCTPERVEQLSSALGTLCSTESGVDYCTTP